MTVEVCFHTGRFNLSTPKGTYLNFDNFGDDLAQWLCEKLKEEGVEVTDPAQEQWGWYFMAAYDGELYIVAIKGMSYGGEDKPDYGEWRLMPEKQRTFWQRLLRKNQISEEDGLVTALQSIIAHEKDMVLMRERTPAKAKE